jgi:Ca-activated chloride channel family protein
MGGPGNGNRGGFAKGKKGAGADKGSGTTSSSSTAKSEPAKLADVAKEIQKQKGDLEKTRGQFADDRLKVLADEAESRKDGKGNYAFQQAREQKKANDMAQTYLQRRSLEKVQAGQLGVDLSVQTNNLRNQSRLSNTAVRNAYARNCVEVGGVWIDEGFDAKMKLVTVKAQSDAYFRILARQPKMREVFRLGNYVVWVTPSGDALVIDFNDGVSKLADADIDRLFVARKK